MKKLSFEDFKKAKKPFKDFVHLPNDRYGNFSYNDTLPKFLIGTEYMEYYDYFREIDIELAKRLLVTYIEIDDNNYFPIHCLFTYTNDNDTSNQYDAYHFYCFCYEVENFVEKYVNGKIKISDLKDKLIPNYNVNVNDIVHKYFNRK